MILQFMVGDGQQNTPVKGSIEYKNPLLANANKIIVEKNAMGSLLEGIHFYRMYYGAIKLMDGRIFDNDEIYKITIE